MPAKIRGVMQSPVTPRKADFSLDLQRKPGCRLISGTELFVSPAAIGATDMFAPFAGIAAKLVHELFTLCREARPVQEQLAALRQAAKAGGIAALKAAMCGMGRECGEPRAPLLPLDAAHPQRLVGEMDAIPALRSEPRAW